MFFAFFVAISQCSFAQERLGSPKPKVTKTPEQRLEEERLLQPGTNDAGLPNIEKPAIAPQRNDPQVICTTWTGSVGPANTATGLRAFRDGVPSTPCGTPGTCTAGLTGALHYVQHTWTNPTAAVQCVTVNFTNPSGANFSFVTVHDGSVNLANLCTNWLGDPGSSANAGQTITFQVNAPPLATLVFHVGNVVAGQTANYTISVDAPLCTPPSPCTGTPAPGNTLSSVTAACPTTNVNLTLQNATPGSGVTYAWERSTVSGTGPWTPFGTSSPSQSVTQTQRTWYRATVTCTNSGNSAISTPVQVDQNPFQACYCASVAGSNADEDIFNVTFGGLNNSSTCLTTAPGPGSIRNRYSNYTTLPASTIVTGNLPISVQIGTCGGNFGSATGVWIDMNQNGAFEHPGEQVFLSGVATGPHTATGMANIPASATIGVTGMRVVNVETGNPAGITPCGAYTWGETEDYLVNIQPCVPVLNPTGPSTFTAQCSGNTTLTVNTGSASLPSFTWEYRVNASSPWQNALAGGLGGVIVSANTNTLQLANVPNSLNGYQFRAVITNPCTAIDFGPAATLTVTKLVATVNPTSATICLGSIQPITLTNTVVPTTVTFNATTGLPVNVPDFNPTGITRTLTVSGIPAGAVVSEVRVNWTMTHTWVGDMVMNIGNPGGNVVNLIGLLDGGTGSNGTANFTNTSVSSNNTFPVMSGAPAPRTGVFRADLFNTVGVGPNLLPTTHTAWQPAMFTNGASVNGTWTLGMADLGPADLGVLQNWSITITYGAAAAGVWTSTPAAPNTMFTDPAATIAYVAGTPVNTIYVKPTVNTTYCVVYNTSAPLATCTSDPTCVTVNVVNPIGTYTVAQPTNKSVCVGGTTTFSVGFTPPAGTPPPVPGPFTYQWQETRNNGLTWTNVTNGGIYSGATTANLTLTGVTRSAPLDMNNFRYRVVVTTTPCAGTFTSSEATLTVNPLPIVTISATDNALLPNQTTVITATSNPAPGATPNWAWTRNGAPFTGTGSTTNSITVGIDQVGAYQATVTDANGCRNSSNILMIDAEVSDKLWLYPNPTSGMFQVRVYYPGVQSEKRRIQVFNSSGQEVLSRDIMLSNTTSPHFQRFDVDLRFQPSGIYVVRVIDLFSKKSVQGFVIKQSQ
jgi:subtilisin-like proprotein convertase family protein